MFAPFDRSFNPSISSTVSRSGSSAGDPSIPNFLSWWNTYSVQICDSGRRDQILNFEITNCGIVHHALWPRAKSKEQEPPGSINTESPVGDRRGYPQGRHVRGWKSGQCSPLVQLFAAFNCGHRRRTQEGYAVLIWSTASHNLQIHSNKVPTIFLLEAEGSAVSVPESFGACESDFVFFFTKSKKWQVRTLRR